jgi:hypothetical protein
MSGGISPCIVNIATGWKRRVSFTPQPLYPRGKGLPAPNREAMWVSKPARTPWRKENDFPLLGIESRTLVHSICILVTIPTELTLLLLSVTIPTEISLLLSVTIPTEILLLLSVTIPTELTLLLSVTILTEIPLLPSVTIPTEIPLLLSVTIPTEIPLLLSVTMPYLQKPVKLCHICKIKD